MEIISELKMDVDAECTINCKLKEHGNLVTKVLTNAKEISEEKLIKYLICICKNFANSRDENVSINFLFLAKKINELSFLGKNCINASMFQSKTTCYEISFKSWR